MAEMIKSEPIQQDEQNYESSNTLMFDAKFTKFNGALSVDASERGNVFTRIYTILKYIFTGKLEI